MKQKRTTYLLLGLALLIWSLIGYRVYKGINQKNDYSFELNTTMIKPPKTIEKEYSLLLDYGNPFQAGKKPQTKAKGRITSQRVARNVALVEVETPQPLEEVIWPTIQYLGLGDKNYKQNETLLISINGDIQMIGRNETIEDMNILSSNEDSIKLYYHGETKVFYNH